MKRSISILCMGMILLMGCGSKGPLKKSNWNVNGSKVTLTPSETYSIQLKARSNKAMLLQTWRFE